MPVLAFERFYGHWLEEEKAQFSALREALQHHKSEEKIESIVRDSYSHYNEYVKEKIRLCEEDASYLVSGMWRNWLESGFLWMGGWRPTTAIVLAYSLMGMHIESELQKFLDGMEVPSMAALSATQLSMLSSLQEKIRFAEDELSNRLAVLQMLLADQQMAKATTAVPPPSESNDLSEIREAMEPKLASLRDLLIEAEQLRAETLREILNILNTIQAAQYALAAYEMALAVQKLGDQRELPCFVPESPSVLHANIWELASQGEAQALEKALQTGFDPSEQDYDGRTPLHLAASRGYADCVALLVKEGSNVNTQDNFGMTPLVEALKAGHDAVAQILVDCGAEAHLEDAGIELCRAAASGDVSYLDRLVRHGVDPNASDYAQRTPLHVAAAEGNPQAVELLVREGANILAKDRHGFTPLDEARASHNPATIRLLEEEMVKQQETQRMSDQDCYDQEPMDHDQEQLETVESNVRCKK